MTDIEYRDYTDQKSPRSLKHRRLIKGHILQEMLDRYQKNNAFFETNLYEIDHSRHFVLHDWDLSRDFTERLLEDSILEFTDFKPDFKQDAFHRIIGSAPIYFLYSIKRLRICWTRYKPTGREDTRTNLIGRYLDAIAAPSHNHLPHWELSALALLPRLKEIEIIFPTNPYQYFAMPDWNNPCRSVFVDLILESLFPWITIPDVVVKLTGAIRSSQKSRFATLHDEAIAKIAAKRNQTRSHKPIITRSTRDTIVDAVRDAESSSKNIRNRNRGTNPAYDHKQLAMKKARQKVDLLTRKMAYSTDRYYMHGDTVSKDRPKQKRGDIPALNTINLHKCKCSPPCVAHERKRFRNIFFDDTDEEIAKYLEWVEVRQDEEYDSDETAGEDG
jgi:hypothetical protein